MNSAKKFTGTIFLLFLFLAAVASALEAPHEKITITGNRQAQFDHDLHLDLGLNCGACHHNSDHEPYTNEEVHSKSDGHTLHCRSCHNKDFKNEKLRDIKVVMHSKCKGCHREGIDGVKGPLRCVLCHYERKK